MYPFVVLFICCMAAPLNCKLNKDLDRDRLFTTVYPALCTVLAI